MENNFFKEITKNHIFIIAEISANHGNSIDVVKKSILKAKEIGCDAVKIQTYTPDTITLDSNKEYFYRESSDGLAPGKTYYELYKEAYTPWEWHKELFDFAADNRITLFSSPFDKTAVDLLESCECPLYKIASLEITDIPLIEYVARTGMPIIISTGIATEQEIEEAVSICRAEGNNNICLLKCVSQYPAKIEDINLLTMNDMRERFEVEIGLSDHSEGEIVALSAAAMGARVIEKHFVLDKSLGGPDASFSIDPNGFKHMIENIRLVEDARGEVTYKLNGAAISARKKRRSLFVVKDVNKGDTLTEENIKSIRPGNGMEPKLLKNVLGRKFKKNYSKGEPLSMEMIE